MGKIYLIRHAQAEGNLYHRVHGWYNSKLTEYGKAQAECLKKRFLGVPIHAIYASDLRRTKETAVALADAVEFPILETPKLREINMGVYEDMPIGEIKNTPDIPYHLFRTRSPQWQAPEGETFLQVQKRMTEIFAELAQRHANETIALFSHKAAIRTLQAALHGLPPQEFTAPPPQNTAVSCYEVKDNRFHILFENDTSHLESLSPCQASSDLSYRPICWSKDEELYRTARRESWLAAHTDLLHFDGPAYTQEAQEQSLWDPRAVQIALSDGEPVGLLQLSTLIGAQAGVGRVPLLWVKKESRRQGVGIQLLGQAISTYRAMGRAVLRLQCSPQNMSAQTFYRKYGFRKVGTVPGLLGELDLLELPL